MSKSEDRSRMDELLDLLADMVAERIRESEPTMPAGAPESKSEPAAPLEEPTEASPPLATVLELEQAPEVDEEIEVEEKAEAVTPRPLGPPHAARLMGRLALGLLLVVILINIPFNRHGTTLATAMPDVQSLAIRDGLVIKVDDAPDIYVYRDGAFHWISSMDAFEHFGYTWADVHIVQADFVHASEIGKPIHVLLKCADSPHIYALENGAKRWIVDIETFEAEGYVWERDIKLTTCEDIRSLPDGETIPPGRGPAPQP